MNKRRKEMFVLCLLIALTGIIMDVFLVVSLFKKEWLAAAMYFMIMSVLSLCLIYLDNKFHPRGLPPK